jgi:hypothetical protein
VPAAAVIPAPIAYIKVVAVKKLVVGFRGLDLKLRGRRPLSARGVRGRTAGGAHILFSKTSRALYWEA